MPWMYRRPVSEHEAAQQTLVTSSVCVDVITLRLNSVQVHRDFVGGCSVPAEILIVVGALGAMKVGFVDGFIFHWIRFIFCSDFYQ